MIIGETAWIHVGNTPFSCLARIDTGASTTSLHAVNIRIPDMSPLPQENIGKTITFQTLGHNKKIRLLSAPIVKVSTIKNSQGIEQRYVIELPLAWKSKPKIVLVNLRDRSQMKYKLLIGRNWLSGDFLVDVDLKAAKR